MTTCNFCERRCEATQVYMCRRFHSRLITNPDPALRTKPHYAHAACDSCVKVLGLVRGPVVGIVDNPCVNEFTDEQIALAALAVKQ